MNEQMIKLDKVKKTCNIAKKIVSVFQIICIVATVLLLIASAFVFMAKDQINQSIADYNATSDSDMNISVSNYSNIVTFSINEDAVKSSGEYAQAISAMTLYGAVITGLFAIALTFVRSIFATISASDTPFDHTVLSKLKKAFVAIAIIITLETGLAIGLSLAGFFLCIYYIMDYGFTLQKEIDETL